LKEREKTIKYSHSNRQINQNSATKNILLSTSQVHMTEKIFYF